MEADFSSNNGRKHKCQESIICSLSHSYNKIIKVIFPSGLTCRIIDFCLTSELSDMNFLCGVGLESNGKVGCGLSSSAAIAAVCTSCLALTQYRFRSHSWVQLLAIIVPGSFPAPSSTIEASQWEKMFPVFFLVYFLQVLQPYHTIFSTKRVLPSNCGMKPRAMAISFTVLGDSRDCLSNNSQGGNSYLTLGFTTNYLMASGNAENSCSLFNHI